MTGIGSHYEYQYFKKAGIAHPQIKDFIYMQVLKKPVWMLSLTKFPIRSELYGLNMLKLNYDGLFGPL